jgi:cell wall-associated NlpC family hydrolase
VGIYAGRDRFIHAPQSGTTVRWSRLSSRRSYYGAVRLVAA